MVAKSGLPSTVAPTRAVTSGYSALVAPSFSFTGNLAGRSGWACAVSIPGAVEAVIRKRGEPRLSGRGGRGRRSRLLRRNSRRAPRPRDAPRCRRPGAGVLPSTPVSYTHLTLPTNREV